MLLYIYVVVVGDELEFDVYPQLSVGEKRILADRVGHGEHDYVACLVPFVSRRIIRVKAVDRHRLAKQVPRALRVKLKLVERPNEKLEIVAVILQLAGVLVGLE